MSKDVDENRLKFRSNIKTTSKVFVRSIFIFVFVIAGGLFISLNDKSDSILAEENVAEHLKKFTLPDLNLDTTRIETAKSYLQEQEKIKAEAARIAAEKRKAEEAARKAAQARALQYSNVATGEVADMIRATFGANADKAIAIANCESHLNTNNVGDLGLQYWQNGVLYGASYGLFQIRYLPGRPDPNWLLNPQNNINKAFEMSGGGANWSAWSCARQLGI